MKQDEGSDFETGSWDFGGYVSQNKDARSEGGEEMQYVGHTRVSAPEDSTVFYLVSRIFPLAFGQQGFLGVLIDDLPYIKPSQHRVFFK